jgi:Zn-finger nucleic acid-binding protein
MATFVVVSVEIDRCTHCGGIVLDKGEPEMIEKLGLSSIIERGAPVPLHLRSTPARCHPCEREMVALMGANDVEYDWCEGCERLFFDRGELAILDAFVDL